MLHSWPYKELGIMSMLLVCMHSQVHSFKCTRKKDIIHKVLKKKKEKEWLSSGITLHDVMKTINLFNEIPLIFSSNSLYCFSQIVSITPPCTCHHHVMISALDASTEGIIIAQTFHGLFLIPNHLFELCLVYILCTNHSL